MAARMLLNTGARFCRSAEKLTGSKSRLGNLVSTLRPVVGRNVRTIAPVRDSLNTPGTTFEEAEVAFEPASYPSIGVSTANALEWEGDLLAITIYEDALETTDDETAIKDAELKKIDESLSGLLSEILADGDFKGKAGSSAFLRLGGKARFVGLVGLGTQEKAEDVAEWGPSVWQTAGSAIAGAAKANKAVSVGISAPSVTAKASEGLARGLLLGGYESTRFKSKAKGSKMANVELLGSGDAAGIETGVALAQGATVTRYLVEAPPNVCTPTHIADAAAAIAESAPDVMSLKVLEKEDCVERKMGCYLGVAQGAAEPLKFVHLTYKPEGEVKKVVALVGKGVTFDSGGYNIKAGAGSMIELMKFDMGGAGAVMGAAKALSVMKPAGVEVHFIVAACENMIAGDAYRPGDVLKASDGTTVEIGNTDAEGRLTLCDALVYAQKECKATSVIDTATLTGACIIALGDGMAGMYAGSEEMAASVSDASKSVGEKLWRMPLEDSYAEMIKSPIADLKNVGGRAGGSITAALFLKHFIEEGVEWAHLDIAGPVWSDKQGGATGFAAATLAQWAAEQGK